MALAGKTLIAMLGARLDLAAPLAIVDVGANPLGKPVYKPLLSAGLAHVWGFEPNAAAFARLEGASNATYLPKAVGAGGPATLHAYPASEMSSLYPLSESAIGYLGHFRRHLGQEERIGITTHRLDDISDIDRIDLLKVDAQGAECDVIGGARTKLAQAVMVIAEMRFYRLYDGEPMLHDLDRSLRDQGFVLHRFLHQKARMLTHSQKGRVNAKALSSQLIDGDAVYIRSFEDRAAWSDSQLRALALLAATIGSHDLALLVLDTLVARGLARKSLPGAYVDLLPQELRA
ncbi:MAG: FkbM family methyltransferase [Paracoccaceae bacterium]|jgi:FkbM family methyltransferase|nr:FkbM family methyltransferase [Paracoccaceae bacterium]